MFDVTKLDSQTIIFGGLTLVALSLVLLLSRVIKQYGNHTNDVITRNTDAWIDNTRSNQSLVDAIDNLKKI